MYNHVQPCTTMYNHAQRFSGMLFTYFLQRCNLKNALFMLLLLLQYGIWAQPSGAIVSTPCEELVCEDVIFYAIPKYPELNPPCTTPSGCSDKARQMTYSIYVESTILDGNTPTYPDGYNLHYDDIRIEARLNSTGSNSRINRITTLECNQSQLANWQGEIFNISNTLRQVSLNLKVDVSSLNECPSDAVLMLPYQTPGDAIRYRALLFDVVVDAYPAETISLQFISIEYKPQSEAICSYQLDGNNPPSGSFMVSDTLTFYTVPLPSSYEQTANQNVQVEVQPIVANPNGTYEIPVVIKNPFPFNAVSVDFFDVTVGLDFTEIMVNPVIQTDFQYQSTAITDNLLVQFLNAQGLLCSIPAGGTYLIGKIIVTGPSIPNLCWNVTARMINQETSRIRTLPASCITQAYLSTNVRTFGNSPNCQPSCGTIGFSVEKGEINNQNCAAQVILKLTDLGHTNPVIYLDEMFIEMEYANVGTVQPDYYALGYFSAVSPTVAFSGSQFIYHAFWPINPNYINLQNPEQVIRLNFTGDGCLENIRIKKIYIRADGDTTTGCVPIVYQNDIPTSICPDRLHGTTKTNEGEGIEDVQIDISGAECDSTCSGSSIFSSVSGEFSACKCASCAKTVVTPSLNLDPLNGVNTWDLILISRHILGLEPLNTPYKLISADANKSGTVTTFDIVELRKLILGTYDSLPNAPSWRFIDKDFIFANPDNPFAPPFPESITFSNANPPVSGINFIGCKVGDVDVSATPNNRPSRTSVSLNWTIPEQNKGSNEVIIPVLYSGVPTLEAIQFGLQYDTENWEFIGTAMGDLTDITPENFGLNQTGAGKMTFSWNVFEGVSQPLQTGQVLFYLSFKNKKPANWTENTLQLDHSWVADAAWEADGTEYALSYIPTVAERTVQPTATGVRVQAIPNPTTQNSTLYFVQQKPGKARLVVSDGWGRQIGFRDLALGTGVQEIALSELNGQPAGLYHWWIKLPDGSIQNGRIALTH